MTETVLEHRYRPRGAMRQAFQDISGEVLLAGPAGTGKTRCCLEKVHTAALKYPNARILMVRKTLESLKSSAMQTFTNHVVAEALENRTVTMFGGNTFNPPQFTYANGSKVMAGGMDKANKVMSAEYDMIYVNEATELTEMDWEALTTRLRNGRMPFQQLIADCNPAEPTHWLKVRCDNSRTKMYDTVHEENPVYFDEDGKMTAQGEQYVAGTLDNLSGVMHDRLRLGLWVAAEGMIYTEFRPSIHVIPRFEVPSSWSRYWAVDFGFVHPFVWQNWVEKPDGELILVQEIYYSGRTVIDHCRQIKEVTKGQPAPQAIIVDSANAEGVTHMERELGMRCTLAKKSVLEGIDAFQTRLKRRRIFFMADAVVERDPKQREKRLPCCTVEEFPGYIWLDADKPKEGPVKKNDDGMDTARYLVAEKDLRHGRILSFIGDRRVRG